MTVRRKVRPKRGAAAGAKKKPGRHAAAGAGGDTVTVDRDLRDPRYLVARARPLVSDVERQARAKLATLLRDEMIGVVALRPETKDATQHPEWRTPVTSIEIATDIPDAPRVGVEVRVMPSLFGTVSGGPPADPTHWVQSLLFAGLAATLDAAAELLDMQTDLTAGPSSTLSLISETVAQGIKRRVLLEELDRAGWNLRLASERLRLGQGTGNILREIRALNLDAALQRARVGGLVKRGRPPGGSKKGVR